MANGQRLVVSDRHTALICNDGKVYTWGGNLNGQLGDGTTNQRQVPVRPIGLENVIQLAATDYATFAVTKEGNAYFWGTSSDNQLGIPSWPQLQTKPTLLSTVSNVRRVAPGESHVAYLLRDGRVAVSGQNSFGVYGNSTETTIDSGIVYSNVSSVVQIASARASCLSIVEDGTIMGWGWNAQNLIDSTTSPSILSPKAISDVRDIEQLNVSYSTEYAGAVRSLSVSGELTVWGKNSQGQLGIANVPVVKIPTKLQLTELCIAVASGVGHTLALMDDGTVWAWGDNSFGQLGRTGAPSSHEPNPVPGLSDVIEIAAGGYTSFAITRDGRLWGWGSNVSNQLNADTFNFLRSPVEIQLPCSITSSEDSESPSNTLALYPNPASDYVNLDLPELRQSQVIDLIVYASNGLEIYRLKHEGTTPCRIDVGALAIGLYHVVVAGVDLRTHYSFVKH